MNNLGKFKNKTILLDLEKRREGSLTSTLDHQPLHQPLRTLRLDAQGSSMSNCCGAKCCSELII